jgi:hypothetical protein
MAPEPPMKSGFFPRFGSKFRYSGRTFYETKNATIDRVPPRFERSLSGRNIPFSRSEDRKQKNDNEVMIVQKRCYSILLCYYL